MNITSRIDRAKKWVAWQISLLRLPKKSRSTPKRAIPVHPTSSQLDVHRRITCEPDDESLERNGKNPSKNREHLENLRSIKGEIVASTVK